MTRLVLECVVAIEMAKSGRVRWACGPCNKYGAWVRNRALAIQNGEFHVLRASTTKESM
jgi:hypothetical protein